ncbi:MAG: hypothetical protein AMJ61_05030 [Desulfobacterales bacterium SG8_35_2]|nr:MAG: hypothetical protein AMJ61_05030 [Desulfobacterales bacterium SG8_35_2]
MHFLISRFPGGFCTMKTCPACRDVAIQQQVSYNVKHSATNLLTLRKIAQQQQGCKTISRLQVQFLFAACLYKTDNSDIAKSINTILKTSSYD